MQTRYCFFALPYLTILHFATQAINADPQSPWGYESKHAALHGLQSYPEAVEAYTRMHSLIQSSPDHDIRRECHLSGVE